MLTDPRSNDDERMPQLKRREKSNILNHPTRRSTGMALCYGNRHLKQLLQAGRLRHRPPSLAEYVSPVSSRRMELFRMPRRQGKATPGDGNDTP